MSRKHKSEHDKYTVSDYLVYIFSLFLFIGIVVLVLYKMRLIGYNNNSHSRLTTTTAVIKDDSTPTPDEPGEEVTTEPNHDRPSVNIDIPEDAYFANCDVNIRSKASTDSTILGVLYKYTNIKVIATEGKWYKFEYGTSDTGYAYVYSDYATNDAAFRSEAIIYLQEVADDKNVCSNIVDKSKASYSYEDMVADLNELHTKYPSILTLKSIATTDGGKDIYSAVIGNKDAPYQIVIHSYINSKDNMAMMLTMNQIEFYLDNYDYHYNADTLYSDLYDKVSLCYIPSVNPDDAKSLSEANNNALHEYVTSLTKPLLSLSYVSTGSNIYWNSKVTDDSAKSLCKELSTFMSTDMKYTVHNNAGTKNAYNADWILLEKAIPSLYIEVGSSPTPLPIAQFHNIWLVNKKMPAMLVEHMLSKINLS